MSEQQPITEQHSKQPLRVNLDYEMLPPDQRVDLSTLTNLRDMFLQEGRKIPDTKVDNAAFLNLLYTKYTQVTDRLSQTQAEPLNVQLRNAAADLSLTWANEVASLEEMTYTDTLTGAVNRRKLDTVTEYLLQKKHEGTQQEGEDAVVFLDGDKFKRINDQFGHATGDEVLKAIVSRLKEHVRSGDVVGRYGGEEFALILPNIKPVQVEAKIDPTTGQEIESARTISPQEVLANRLEDIREIIASTVAPVIGVTDLSLVTASIGATFVQEHDTTLKEVYERADKNLYDAKNDTRNCVYIDGTRITPRAHTNDNNNTYNEPTQ